MSDSRRAPSTGKKKTAAKPRTGFRRGPRATAVIIDEVPNLAAEHPGVLAAHDGRVTAAECAHPAARRDLKNPARCCACGAVGLDPPAKRR